MSVALGNYNKNAACAAAFLVNQFKYYLGIDIRKSRGAFKAPEVIRDMCRSD